VEVAAAGRNRQAVVGRTRIPRRAGARFPLAFNRENVSLIGDQLAGQPYGWGEMYDLRDCSAMLRDMFLPFGIWLPRTSSDQIASIPRHRDISRLTPPEKAADLVRYGHPFLTLFYKPGHVMLYLGTDQQGQPLVFHSIWSLRVKEGAGQRRHYIATSAVTTLEPGKELGLVEGSSLLEEGTLFATITDRCSGAAGP
jgi:cell wall-associated NlpC family hydrolase